jgi:hypothetical protein
MMMKDEKPLLCRKDFKRKHGGISSRSRKSIQAVNENMSWAMAYVCPRIEQAEGRRLIISGAAHGDPDHPTYAIWILDMLLAEAAMNVIGSDEAFRRCSAASGRWVSPGMAASREWQLSMHRPFKLMVTCSYKQTGAYLRYLGLLEIAPSLPWNQSS